jgi:hypothetical protein
LSRIAFSTVSRFALMKSIASMGRAMRDYVCAGKDADCC